VSTPIGEANRRYPKNLPVVVASATATWYGLDMENTDTPTEARRLAYLKVAATYLDRAEAALAEYLDTAEVEAR